MNRLKELRKQKKLTIVELAEKVGVTKLTILNWEHGTHEVNSSQFKTRGKPIFFQSKKSR
ncbi:helix-turn-helix transcriptional regulator [Streptococcus thermophilus]|uniref:helix-turn-helix transcriptional regulator n=1 Tax=Streptococcus thermophilus TaxID=1308 RepID=UPI003A5C879B